MEQGDFAMVLPGLGDMDKDLPGTPEERSKEYIKALRDFGPDVIIFNSIGGFAVGAWREEAPEIPYIQIELQPQGIPSNDYKNSQLQRDMPDPDTPKIMTHVWSLNTGLGPCLETYQKLSEAKAPKEDYLKAMDTCGTPEQIWENTFEMDKRLLPCFLAYSPSFWPNPDDWPKTDNIKVLGNFKLSKEVQEELIKEGNTFFNVGKDYELCADFIAKGEPPVYIGWGSMMVWTKQFMTKLAVEACKRAGVRAIILGGWALLDVDGLDGAEGEEELKAYCKDNILFVRAAPHELLFPQCKACVHHGGIGTLQVSLSSGCPTVITPVFADQFDNAEHLKKIGCGMSTTRLGILKSNELGDAIKAICTDSTFKEKTSALAAAMQKEEGCNTMVAWIEKFVSEEVRTKKFEERRLADKERLYELRTKAMRLNAAQIMGKWNNMVNQRYPAAKAFNIKTMSFMAMTADLIGKGTVWWVQGSGSLAREGEGLKTPEVGRFKQFAILEELEKKGSRLKVKRLRGRGPNEGWVTPTVNGKDVVAKIADPGQLGMITQQEFTALFADLLPHM